MPVLKIISYKRCALDGYRGKSSISFLKLKLGREFGKAMVGHDRLKSDPLNFFKNCHLCPRDCGVNRLDRERVVRSSFCGESSQLRVAYVGPHFGEEPPITGKKGSGTIFFSGCSLKCVTCQNHQISRDGLGKTMPLHELYHRLEDMIRIDGVHNINFVTPDHFFPHVYLVATCLDLPAHIFTPLEYFTALVFLQAFLPPRTLCVLAFPRLQFPLSICPALRQPRYPTGPALQA